MCVGLWMKGTRGTGRGAVLSARGNEGRGRDASASTASERERGAGERLASKQSD